MDADDAEVVSSPMDTTDDPGQDTSDVQGSGDQAEAGVADSDAGGVGLGDAKDVGFELDAMDSSDAGDVGPEALDVQPTPLGEACTDCVEGESGCEDLKTGWKCVFDYPPGAGPDEQECLHVVKTKCEIGVCVDYETCDCPTEPGTLCWDWGISSSVWPDCKAQDGPPLEECGFPGCVDGACVKENPESQQLWPLPTGQDLTSAVPMAPDRVFVGGPANVLSEFEDGTWWDRRNTDTLHDYRSLKRSPAGHLLRFGTAGIRVRNPDGTWSWLYPWADPPETPSTGEALVSDTRDAWVFDEQNLVVANNHGGIFHVQGGVGTWVADSYPELVAADVRSVWGSAPDNIYAVGAQGLAIHYDGVTWQPIPGLSSELGAPPALLGHVRGSPDGEVVYVMREHHALRGPEDDWAIAYVAPEGPNIALFPSHRAWVAAADDVWVYGDYTISHYDGQSWTTQVTGYEDRKLRLRDLRCLDASECWAVGQRGLVLHYEAGAWTTASLGHGDTTDPPGVVTALWGSSPETIYAAISPDLDHMIAVGATQPFWVRRHTLEDGEVVDTHSWKLGEWSWKLAKNRPIRGLWGTGPDNVFVCAVEPRVFDGNVWLPLEGLPPGTRCEALFGQGDDLYLALRIPVPGGFLKMIAHKKVAGSDWTLEPTPFLFGNYPADFRKLWLDDDGNLWGFDPMFGVGRRQGGLEGTGEWMKVLGLYSYFAWERQFAVTHANEVLVVGTWSEEALQYLLLEGFLGWYPSQFADGTQGYLWPFGGNQVAGIVLPPSGPGVLAAGAHLLYSIGMGEQPMTLKTGGDPVTGYSIHSPYAFVHALNRSIWAAPWGELYVGAAGEDIRVLDAPWAGP